MSSSPVFFQENILRPAAVASEKIGLPLKSPGLIHTDGRSDLACAIMLIDRFLAPTLGSDDDLASMLLSHVFHDAPNHPRPPGSPDFLTPSKYMQQVCLQHDNLGGLIESLSLTLKRLAIEHILNNQRYYHAFFNHSNQPLSGETLQRDNHRINPWLMRALSNILPLEFVLIETQDKKSLAKRHDGLNSKTSHPQVIMHWQGNRCVIAATVMFSSWFDSINVNSLNVPPLSQEAIASYSTRASEQIARLEKENHATLKKYHLTRHRLSSMIAKQDVSEQEVLSLYIHALAQQSDSIALKKHLGTEYGTQHFFERLQGQYPLFKTDSVNAVSPSGILDGLIDALARSITLGDMPDITQKMRHQETLDVPIKRMNA